MSALYLIDAKSEKGAASGPWRDPLFWLSVSAGPLIWLLFYLWTAPVFAPERFWTASLSPLLLVVVYPCLEEWLFRGRIQGALLATAAGRRQWRGISVANIITTSLFVAFHFLSHPLLWAMLVFFPSLLFGLLRDRYGRIGPSIMLHAFYNAGYFTIWPPG